MSSTTDNEPHIRPFVDVLVEVDRGGPSAEATRTLHELIEIVKATGRKGSFSVSVTVEPMNKDSEMVTLSVAVLQKFPRPDVKKLPFFITADGNLSSRDPRQLAFESIKVVDAPTVKDVKHA